MRARLVASAAIVMLSCMACGRRSEPAPAAQSRSVPLPQTSGTLTVDGLIAPVTVVRDRWGVPHITAAQASDLFFAQGFVQAQDRLFQMDLWRRSSQGRLAEVLGANFIERDAMTRRMHYRGDVQKEWESYGPEVRAIAEAFTRGVNAWITTSQDAWPDEFRLAGWTPERWSPEDLLNRTDAFVASRGAQDEVFRARLAAVIGADRVNALLPPPDGRPARPSREVDLRAITGVLGETLLRVGTRPFFSGLAGSLATGSNAWAVDASRAATGAPLLAVDPHRSFDAPSLRYLVHLSAPGWNVLGATSPWLPGVAVGHNERLAWGMTAADADTQDLYVERTNPSNPRQVEFRGRWIDMEIEPDTVAVKGRSEPFVYERQYTRHGVVVGLDRERHLAYVLRWSGSELGAAAELGALALDRAQSIDEFRTALTRWKMPAVDVVFAARDGGVARQRAALQPVRRGAAGLYPSEGWSGANEWDGWRPLDQLPHAEAGATAVFSANDDLGRNSRIAERLAEPALATVDSFEGLQHDTTSWTAGQLLPLLGATTPGSSDVEEAKRRLLTWDHRMTATDPQAALYAKWEERVAERLSAQRVPAEFARGLSARVPLARVLAAPTSLWFDGEPRQARDALLLDALTVAVASASSDLSSWTSAHRVSFVHPLAVSDATRRRFNVGPFPFDGAPGTVQVLSPDGRIGPAFRAVFDSANWDRSTASSAPGQSAWPDSPHAADLGTLWAAGKSFPLPYSASAIAAATSTTLTLTPP